MELADFKNEVRAVGRELGISQDWLNDYFSTFLFVLPKDYGDRLVPIFKGKHLDVCALGKEDLILIKCSDELKNSMTDAPWLLPLNSDETARLYWELGRRGAYCDGEPRPWAFEELSEEELQTLAILQSRYDPRLMAILIDYFRSPRSLNPIEFKHLLRKHQALPPMAVIGEFVLSQPVPEEVRDFFQFLAARVRRVSTQLYYRGIYPLGGTKMREAVDKPLWAFKKWGYLASDSPFLKDRITARRTFLFDLPSRLWILRELLQGGARFRLRDYLEKIGFSISRQQALKDVKSTPWIRSKGQGRGAYYEIIGSAYPTTKKVAVDM